MNAEDYPERNYPAKQAGVSKGNRSVIAFVTVCTKSRKPILARPEIHGVLVQSWLAADSWLVGCYMVLPDHIHLFCSPAKQDAPNVKRWVGYWKSLSSKGWPHPRDKPVWQRDCWDRQLRHGESWKEKWIYVQHNPVRHNLVQNTEDWCYQGEINHLEWHDA